MLGLEIVTPDGDIVTLGSETLEDWKLRFEGEEHYINNKSIFYDLILICMTVVFMVRKFARRLFGRKPATAGPK